MFSVVDCSWLCGPQDEGMRVKKNLFWGKKNLFLAPGLLASWLLGSWAPGSRAAAFWAPRPPKVQPLLHFWPLDFHKCNPYCILGSRTLTNATPSAFWVPRPSKMQPLLYFWPLDLQKCNPYCILGPSTSWCDFVIIVTPQTSTSSVWFRCQI